MSFKYTSRHQWWYAATQESHGTTYVVLTLSLLIRPVWPSTYDELVSLIQKKKTFKSAYPICEPPFSHSAERFLRCFWTFHFKLRTLWGRTVRCAKSWLFSTTGSSVSSED